MKNNTKKLEKNGSRIMIFDTTLRDGEQTPGFHMFPKEKMEIAKQLAKMKVDIIEAGFAVSSPGDAMAIYRIAQEVGTKDGPAICSLARSVDKDIEAAARALEPAYRPRIHVFIATSDIHIDKKFRKTQEWVIEKAAGAVKKARSYVDDVEFSCEDFGRTEKDYTVKVVCEAIKSGASTINLPDTVGWLLPDESYEKVKYVIEKVREFGYDAVFSVHNHNDLGMAAATTIQAIKAGARQAEVTVNGIGERAGNTALEEVVAIIKARKIGYCNVDSRLIGETSRLVSKYTGAVPQPNKAIVGRNAFAHEAGIHQDGMLKDKNTYEIMDPVDYGVESIITFGPRSGRNALRAKYREMSMQLDDGRFEEAASAFTSLADNIKEVDDADIVRSTRGGEEIPIYYELALHQPMIEEGHAALIKMKVGGEIRAAYGRGNGQLDAAINAISKIVQRSYELKDFKASSEGPGSDAIGITRLEMHKNNWKVIGKSKNTDIVTSSINAFIDGCNRMKYIEDCLG